MNLLFIGLLAPGLGWAGPSVAGSYLAQPSHTLDRELRYPLEPYVPQPGDIFMATDRRLWFRWGHRLAGANGVHHSGIVFARPDGSLGLIEAGPFEKLTVEVMNPYDHMSAHCRVGDCVWVRRRKVPLTPEQSARLTQFAMAQVGKPFAVRRWLWQLTPLRLRTGFKIWFVGHPQGHRRDWFCSELVVECCVAAGIMDRETSRPTATYPRDFFLDRSENRYLRRYLDMESGWYPPARWRSSADGGEVRPSPQAPALPTGQSPAH
jgi:hypothetical protein